MNEPSQLAAAIEIVEAVFGHQLTDAHLGVVGAVLAAIRANHADAGSVLVS